MNVIKSNFMYILDGVDNQKTINMDTYISRGGYDALKKSLSMGKDEIIRIIKESGLTGRGGAAFPTGLKWEFVRKSNGSMKYVVCNADEGEPGTFKDRVIMEKIPHLLIEGMIVAAYAIGAKKGYIYVRGEYDSSINSLSRAIEEAKKSGFLGDNILGSDFSFDIEISRGAGSYVCGEETALLNSIEGLRGEPRRKPPYPPDVGLFGKPTLINNVETLANVPLIIKRGSDWFKTLGVEGSYGTKLFSVSGDVAKRGVVELPFGTNLSAIIEITGGVIDEIKAVILGGVSGSLITPENFSIPVDYNSLSRIDATVGSGAIIVLNKERCIVDVVKNILYFFKHESCGKCTPCRVGTQKAYEIVDKISKGFGVESDIELLIRLGKTMKSTSFCGLGQTAPNVMLQSLRMFEDEWLAHIKDKVCPAIACDIKQEDSYVGKAS